MAGNPVFKKFENGIRSGQYVGFDAGNRSGMAGQAGQSYGLPSYGAGGPGVAAPSDRMTMDDVVTKALNLFGLLIVVAGATFVVANRAIDSAASSTALGLWAGGGIVAFVLSLIISFRRSISVPLILGYTLFEGVFLGAASAFFNSAYPGVVAQAILATMCVFGGMLLGYKTGLIRVTARSRRIFTAMILGYALFALVNFALVLFHVQSGFGIGGSGPLGIGISLLAVALASYSLAMDFDSIRAGIDAGAPSRTSWLMAYGLMVSVVWLYVEMLRLISRLRD